MEQEPERRRLAGRADLACGGPGGCGPGGGDLCDDVVELERDGLGFDQPPKAARIARVIAVRVRAQFCWTSSVADAGTSHEKVITKSEKVAHLYQFPTLHLSLLRSLFLFSHLRACFF